MSSPIFWRMVWKEYRTLQGLWFVLALPGLLLLAVAVFARTPSLISTGALLSIVLVLVALYAVGCAPALFAAEREEKTVDQLLLLPITSQQVFVSKLTVALSSLLGILVLLWLSGFLMLSISSGGGRDAIDFAQEHRTLWGFWGVAAVEAFAWGLLFSLLSSRPLVAVCLSIAAASLAVHLVLGITIDHRATYSIADYASAAPWRLTVAAAVLAVDVWIGLGWLTRDDRGRGTAEHAERSSARIRTTRSYFAGVPGLLWQTYRESWRLILGYLAVGAVALAIGYQYSSDHAWIALAAVSVIAPLAGALVFSSDWHLGSKRFLAERGVPARRLWLSRHAVWLPVVLLWSLMSFLVLLGDDFSYLLLTIRSTNPAQTNALDWQYTGYRFAEILNRLSLQTACGWAVLTMYAVGQLCSMLIRSGLLAVCVSLLAGVAALGWVVLMHLGAIPLIWSVIPIPALLMLTTWLWTPSWLIDRPRWRAAGLTLLLVLLPAIAIGYEARNYRISEIPQAYPRAQVEPVLHRATPTEAASAALYVSAGNLLVERPVVTADDSERVHVATFGRGLLLTPHSLRAALTDQDRHFVQQNQAALDAAITASEAPVPFFDAINHETDRRSLDKLHVLQQLTLTSARQAEADGDLDLALSRYLAALRMAMHRRNYAGWPEYGSPHLERATLGELVHWANASGQSADRVLRARQQMDAIFHDALRPLARLQHDYAALLSMLDQSSSGQTTAAFDTKSSLFLTWLPGEAQRVRRIIDFNYQSQAHWLQLTDEQLAARQIPEVVNEHRDWRWPREQPWVETTYSFQSQRLSTAHTSAQTAEAHRMVEDELFQRAASLLLAIAAWEADHGELPAALDELVGKYIDSLPIDPYTAEPFRFLPNGLAQYLAPRIETRPMLWSPGIDVLLPEMNPLLTNHARIWTWDSVQDVDPTHLQVWQAGVSFVIP